MTFQVFAGKFGKIFANDLAGDVIPYRNLCGQDQTGFIHGWMNKHTK